MAGDLDARRGGVYPEEDGRAERAPSWRGYPTADQVAWRAEPDGEGPTGCLRPSPEMASRTGHIHAPGKFEPMRARVRRTSLELRP